MSNPKTHAEYIASFPLPIRRKLKEMRALIREEAPDALESISYGVAAFSVDGPLVYIAGFRNHVSFFRRLRESGRFGRNCRRTRLRQERCNSPLMNRCHSSF